MSNVGGIEREESLYRESRLHQTMHSTAFPTHLVTGSLNGTSKLPIDPLTFFRTRPRHMAVSILYIGSNLCGHPGYIHGGVPFALFDDLFARCAGLVLPSGVAVTANMGLDFRKPALPDRVYVLRAEITKHEGRKVWLKGSMRCLNFFNSDEMGACQLSIDENDMSLEERTADLAVEANALFMEPKSADVRPISSLSCLKWYCRQVIHC
jgi:acyl-coenzyme A thioesterase PaaI-like protein